MEEKLPQFLAASSAKAWDSIRPAFTVFSALLVLDFA
jgi:hypothetical protein